MALVEGYAYQILLARDIFVKVQFLAHDDLETCMAKLVLASVYLVCWTLLPEEVVQNR